MLRMDNIPSLPFPCLTEQLASLSTIVSRKNSSDSKDTKTSRSKAQFPSQSRRPLNRSSAGVLGVSYNPLCSPPIFHDGAQVEVHEA